MAKVFTQEEREKIKGQVVELVRRSGRETLRQLEVKTGATRYLMSVLARELVASGDVYNSGYGLFPSEQARKDWQNARKKLSRAKLKEPSAVDPDLIWSLPDGEIRRYDRRQNIICRECRKSEVMQRILAFYQGNARYLLKCSGQQKLATALEFFQYRFSDSFGGNPPLYSCGLSAL
ncbi:phage protein [Escherichia coli]|nr:phage protein [Escherichia coli]CTZ15915.1 phage protein [Escherichia coli]